MTTSTLTRPSSPSRAVPYGTLPATGLVRQKDMLPCLPFASSQLWRLVRAGKFPAPIKLSERVTCWRVEDVRAYLADHPQVVDPRTYWGAAREAMSAEAARIIEVIRG